MKLLNLSGPQDVIALLLRRKWWVLLPFVGLSAAVILITILIPALYVSQSLILIKPPDVPTDVVKDMNAGTAAERLAIFTEQLLSDSNLQAILKQYEDELPEYARLNMDQRIVKLRKQITVGYSGTEQVQKGQPPSGFRISCQNREPLIAQNIVKTLVDVLMREDKKTRQAAVIDTARFFQNHVDDLKEKQAVTDDKLSALRSRKPNEMPDQRDWNLRKLDSLRNDNRTLRSERAKVSRERELAAEEIAETPQQILKIAPARTPAPESPRVVEYRRVRETLLDNRLLGRKSEHPDVLTAEKKLRELEQLMTPEQIALANQDPAQTVTQEGGQMLINPRYLTLRNREESLRRDIEEIDENISQNNKEIQTYESYIQNTPKGAAELTELQRESNTNDRKLDAANLKLDDVQLSASAQIQQKGSQFELQDPASLPLTPAKPSKLSILSSGLVLSLLISIALAFLVDVAYQKSWSPSDISRTAGVRVLIEVPRIVTRDGAAKALKKKAAVLTSVSIAAVAYASFLCLAYAHPGFVLRQLDPLIQKFY
jgi:polysaccharide biosynthesis transport protein